MDWGEPRKDKDFGSKEGEEDRTTKYTKYTKREKEMEGSVIPCKEESYRVMGACFEVYKEKGCGFLEAVYQECLEIELELRGIPFNSKAELVLNYKGRALKKRYEPDFICFDKIIMDIKAVSNLVDDHRAQVHNYLRATNLRLGLLANFGHHPLLEYERIVL
jgi:GxxExxY protein